MEVDIAEHSRAERRQWRFGLLHPEHFAQVNRRRSVPLGRRRRRRRVQGPHSRDKQARRRAHKGLDQRTVFGGRPSDAAINRGPAANVCQGPNDNSKYVHNTEYVAPESVRTSGDGSKLDGNLYEKRLDFSTTTVRCRRWWGPRPTRRTNQRGQRRRRLCQHLGHAGARVACR